MNEGMRVDLVRADGEREALGEFAVVALPFMDLVFEARRVVDLYPGDELLLSFDVPVVSFENDRQTNSYVEHWKYSTGVIEEETRATHFRFTKSGDEAWIELLDGYEKAPYIPSGDRAVRIR